ncbi:MAG TPA: Asp-tRNA(Asn)/Glu-tRNA(Gln) amidotransferase GatCAB subunit B, partial [Dehalococcoidia bacterium]|nr:Asp-tRNA(Asn)/Glu-tRNA(Gln) amidotransferase GatCAB subunit B [Dehalococcoidia bacterium]
FEEMFNQGRAPQAIIEEKGLGQISDNAEIENMIDVIIKKNPQAIADYRAGKQQTMGFLIGQVMKVSQGRANPETVKKILIEKLGGS